MDRDAILKAERALIINIIDKTVHIPQLQRVTLGVENNYNQVIVSISINQYTFPYCIIDNYQSIKQIKQIVSR